MSTMIPHIGVFGKRALFFPQQRLLHRLDHLGRVHGQVALSALSGANDDRSRLVVSLLNGESAPALGTSCSHFSL